MKLTKKMCRVIAELEYLIGSECYNPNSYDGWNYIEGCDYRYPISVPDTKGEYTKVRGSLNSAYNFDPNNITPETVSYMKYKFGSNELFIGRGIIRVLQYLEKRYQIDFSELEKTKRANTK